jgi:hypothetical protein
MKNLKKFILSASISLAVILMTQAAIRAQILLNEVEADPNGPNTLGCQYIELRGTPGAAIPNGTFYLSIDSENAANGMVDESVNLGGKTFGSNGTIAIIQDETINGGGCPGRTFPAGTTVVKSPTFGGVAGQSAESFLLVTSQAATPPAPGDDIDTNDDGVIETARQITVLDGITYLTDGQGQRAYAPVVFSFILQPTAADTADASTRFPNNSSALSAPAWYSGELASPDNSTTYTDPRSSNFPVGGALTPGSPNVPAAAAAQHVIDFNGDGKTDFSVVRNSGGGNSGQLTWFIAQNGSGATTASDWGIASDFVTPGDFDGDGKTDIAIWRPANPGSAQFFILQSQTETLRTVTFGQSGDDPTVIGDYDGDGKFDPAVYRPGASVGQQSTWFFLGSLNNPSNNITFVPWGVNGDKPATGDYDGDGKSDFVIRRDESGSSHFWELLASGSIDASNIFGLTTDTVVPGDYDGDSKTDLAIVRDVSGSLQWWWKQSSNATVAAANFGSSATDFPTQGDYDGDGKTDLAIWRPGSPGTFWFVQSGSGTAGAFQFGLTNDFPAANYNTH